jgi:hypothetical protein
MSSPLVVKVKELDPEIIAPSTRDMHESDKGGAKLVVIGKPGCFARGTNIMRYDGSLANVEDIQQGDTIMGDDSTPRTVLSLCRNRESMYAVTPEYGETYTVNEGHKLVLINDKKEITEVTVRECLSSPEWQDDWKIFRVPVDFPESVLNVSPYTFGNVLGKSNNGIVHTTIPNYYIINNRDNRRALLAGLIDNCGNQSADDAVDIYHTLQVETNRISFLARSLGLLATVTTLRTWNGGAMNRITIRGDLNSLPCKQLTFGESSVNVLSSNFSLVSVGEDDYYGFTIDGNHRFLLGSCDVVRNTGKSTLIASLLYAKKHIFPVGIAMSGTELSNGFYSKIFPDLFVYPDYDEAKLQDFVRRQRLAKEHLPVPWAVCLLDDCTDDPRIFNKPLQHGLYKRGRHFKMLYILSLQFALDIKPVIRTSVDGVFILREPNLRNRKVLWENYASIIPDFHMFCEVMDQITNDYTALYIHNAAHTSEWQDCVYYYKATPVPKSFRFGCDDFWKFHHARYNTEYEEPLL